MKNLALLICCIVICGRIVAENPATPPASTASTPPPPAGASVPPKQENQELVVDFSSEDTFVDQTEALRSRQYVHRAILAHAIKETTTHFNVGRIYINHLVGFSNIWQRRPPAPRYVSGIQALYGGYIFKKGHGIEGGLELSAVSNLTLGYRYFVLPSPYSLWPYIGLGAGTEIKGLSIADGPAEAAPYDGDRSLFYGVIGFVIPLLDIGIKAEGKLCLYGTNRLVLTTGLGAVVFL